MALLDRIPKKGKVYRRGDLLFWAQGGCICTERMDQDGSFKALSRAEFVARIIMERDALKADCYNYNDERDAAAKFVVEGCASVKEAKLQGDPFDPQVLEEQQRERENNKGYILLSGGGVHMVDGAGGGTNDNLPPRVVTPGTKQKAVLRTHGSQDYPNRAKDLPKFGPDPKKG